MLLERPLGEGFEEELALPAEGEQDGSQRAEAASRWSRLRSPEAIVTLLVVAACVVFTFVQLKPSLLFRNTTPAGGDMGAHVWLPAYIKNNLFPHLRIDGWTMDNYDGFPVLTYYFPLPIIAIAVLSYAIPYNIAFKLVSVAGLLALPVAAWALGRLARMRFPGPACLAVATVPFLFNRDFTIYGGNIASTMAGEFAFSISLAFALVFLGVVARGLDNGRHRALAAVLLACCALSHILPFFFALVGALVLTAMKLDWRRLRWTLPMLVVAGLLMAFWALPLYFGLPYATNMGYQNLTNYMGQLFPSKDIWLYLLAAIGATLSVQRRERVGIFLAIMAFLVAVGFAAEPQGRLWNARFLPFWFLCLYLLAGVALYQLGAMAAEALRSGWRPARHLQAPVPVLGLLIALLWVGYPLHILPFGRTTSNGQYDWLGIKSSDSSFVPSWVTWNYSGYQSADKPDRAEYFALIKEMSKIGKDPAYGCGRAMWEYEPQINDMGTPDALMLLPYWTHGCIASQEGLYYESSATTPYHFLNAAELSANPSNPVRGLDYPTGPDVVEGVEHLQMLGVKYFMAVSPQVQQQADADSSLKLIATVGPYEVPSSVGNTSQEQRQTWNIYEVQDSPLVAPLANQPVVMKGVSGSKAWLAASERWYLDPSRWQVYEAASGPRSWARVSASDTDPPATPLPPVQVSDVHETEQSVSFHVDRTGVPVLVKVSYYPNWQASGASGPWRVTPNLMVVVPTSNQVTLSYGYSALDWLAFVLSLLGLGLAVLLWRLRPVSWPAPLHAAGRSPSDRLQLLARQRLAEPTQRLAVELSDAYPPGLRQEKDIDVWLGQPGGLELARYYASQWVIPEDAGTAAKAGTGTGGGALGSPGDASGGPAPAQEEGKGAEPPGTGGGTLESPGDASGGPAPAQEEGTGRS